MFRTKEFEIKKICSDQKKCGGDFVLGPIHPIFTWDWVLFFCPCVTTKPPLWVMLIRARSGPLISRTGPDRASPQIGGPFFFFQISKKKQKKSKIKKPQPKIFLGWSKFLLICFNLFIKLSLIFQIIFNKNPFIPNEPFHATDSLFRIG